MRISQLSLLVATTALMATASVAGAKSQCFEGTTEASQFSLRIDASSKCKARKQNQRTRSSVVTGICLQNGEASPVYGACITEPGAIRIHVTGCYPLFNLIGPHLGDLADGDSNFGIELNAAECDAVGLR